MGASAVEACPAPLGREWWTAGSRVRSQVDKFPQIRALLIYITAENSEKTRFMIRFVDDVSVRQRPSGCIDKTRGLCYSAVHSNQVRSSLWALCARGRSANLVSDVYPRQRR